VTLGTLTVGKQQMVEIAKAVSQECRLLVLDEPTAALTQTEVEELFKIMNDLRQKGIGMIYISHRMDEINRISDRVTVMRDGEYIGTLNTAETTKDEIVRMMVGRTIFSEKKEQSTVPQDAPVVLEVKNLNAGKEVKNVSFTLKKGEILGFAGLMGAGRTETVRAIYGADRKDSGQIFINGKEVSIKTPQQAVSNGICYLSEDRKRYGLLLDKSVSENSVLASLDDYISGGWINDKKIAEDAEKANGLLRTKTPSMQQLLKNLSGGNQQKVIIARWLLKNSDIFIFDEPTRGIDVGAKSEIYDLMENLTKEGKSIIMISSELAEVQRLSDRVIVMCEGNVTAELDIKDASQEEIMKYATLRREN
jgi:ribose transport system ATP-binding protein